ncbi:MAG: peptide chain release factor 2 [Saccharofermentanales bacterium]|jgi:peptide chain release factor 2|nr:peptide chain release factor 2 [Clostridiaceae bacterium]
MIEFDQYKQTLAGLAEDFDRLREALHIRQVGDEIAELEARAQSPDFWEDVDRAQRIQTRVKHLQKKVDRFDRLMRDYEDLQVLCELGAEAEDADLAAEVGEGLDKLEADYEALRLETLFTGEHDANNAILSLHAGAGGTEAQDWTEMLFRMYTRWAEAHEFQIKIVDILEGEEAGLKSVSFMVIGDNAYGYLRTEMGVHRLVRISPFDSSGRRHTSFASLEVVPELDDSIKIDIRPEDLRVDTYRSSGAGGQHVNKTESAIRITHLPTGVVVSCQTERSQIQNRETAMNMLKAKLFAMARAAQMDRIEDLKGNQMDIAWGSQIRSYVFCPYTMVKDHRTGYEMGDVEGVMNGDLDGFINASLSGMKMEK